MSDPLNIDEKKIEELATHIIKTNANSRELTYTLREVDLSFACLVFLSELEQWRKANLTSDKLRRENKAMRKVVEATEELDNDLNGLINILIGRSHSSEYLIHALQRALDEYKALKCT